MKNNKHKTPYRSCPRLEDWLIKAYNEYGSKPPRHFRAVYGIPYTKLPQSIYKNPAITSVEEKIYDFIFIGRSYWRWSNRDWLFKFIKQYFNSNSYLKFTDIDTCPMYTQPLGDYDYSGLHDGYAPSLSQGKDRYRIDDEYLNKMAKSRFCLCPGGDSNWSMRFYEAIMCKCIPIFYRKSYDMFRTQRESELPYKYYTYRNFKLKYNTSWVEQNYQLFLTYHTLFL